MQRKPLSNDQALEIKTAKTAVLFGVTNIFVGLLSIVNSNSGILAFISLNSALMYYLHDLGKSRRVGANAINTGYSFFSSRVDNPGHDVENAYRNVINGGAAVVDEIEQIVHENQHRFR